MSNLKVYAWTKPGVPNFGDEMGPDILRRLGHTVERVPVEQAEVIVCGSVLEKASRAPQGCVIAGAGIMQARSRVDSARLDIRAVRGRLSLGALTEDAWPTSQGGIALGDPGILASTFYQLAPKYGNRVGVVPHYVDERKFPWADVVIDVLQPPDDVIYQISGCSAILSSSLHGLIVAQSLNIPAQRLPHPKVGGGDTKWIDYATGVMDEGSLYGTKEKLYEVLEKL